MKTIPFLLDSFNQAVLDNKTIAQRIQEKGKEHLWDNRSEGMVDTVVIHFASAAEVKPQTPFELGPIIGIFCDLGVSSHYIIDREGCCYALVPEDKRAWHCGGSIMPSPDDRRNVNEFSLGIELIATADLGFTADQYKSLSELCRDIEQRYSHPMLYVGHQDIAGGRAVRLGLRNDKKDDPGSMFDWPGFLSDVAAL